MITGPGIRSDIDLAMSIHESRKTVGDVKHLARLAMELSQAVEDFTRDFAPEDFGHDWVNASLLLKKAAGYAFTASQNLKSASLANH